MGLEQLQQLQLISEIICNGLSIITVVCIIYSAIINYKFGVKFEKKFGIPKEYFSFDFKKMLIDTSEYILMYFSLYVLFYCSINKQLTFSEFENINLIIKGLLLFSCFFFYIVIIVIIIQDIKNKRIIKSICCYVLLFLVLPIILTILCLNCKFIMFVTAIILFLISFIGVVKYIYYDFNFKKYIYDIVFDNNKYYVIFPYNKEFIVMELLKDNNVYKVKEKGNYMFEKCINKKEVYHERIEE